MRILRAWIHRWGGLFRKRQRDVELGDELESHLQMQIEDNLRSGMDSVEARRQAFIKLGGVEQTKEQYRDLRGIHWLETVIQTVRFGLRLHRKYLGFTTVVLLTLALGIGATTAMFTIAYAVLLAPSPYPNSNQLVNIWSKIDGHRDWVSAGDFADWKRHSTAFEDLNATSPSDFNIATQDRPEFVDGLQATPGYYSMLGGQVFLGRNFISEEGEPGKSHVVILTYRLWQHLGSNQKIIGQTMQINGDPYTVVGVLAQGTADRWDEELIVPIAFNSEQLSNHDSRYWVVTGRLRPGATIRQAQAEMESVAAEEAKLYPKADEGRGALVEPLKNDFLPSDRKLTLWLLLGAVGFLLLIACLNVANLLLANGITRQREVAIRGTLGATPSAIFMQFLTEGLGLAIAGGVLGLAAGHAILGGLVELIPQHALPPEADLRLNAPVLLVMLTTTTLAGVFFGCAPAWYASRSDPAAAMKEGGQWGIDTGRHRLRRILVIAEFALALPLLAGAGLAIRSFWNLTHVDLGIRADHVFGFYLAPSTLSRDPKQIDQYYRRVLASIEAVPGVSNASAMSYLPLDSLHASKPFAIAGQSAYASPSLRPSADFEMVTPDYYQTFGIQIVKGRAFTEADRASSARVAMVNDAFVRRFLKGTDPLQQRVVMEQVMPNTPQPWPVVEWQIVGVFHTVKSRGLREENPEIDTPFSQGAFPISAVGVRTDEDPASMIKSIADAVNQVDAQAALYKPRTLQQIHDEVLANDRFSVALFGGFAMIGLALAAVGIHGVTAFTAAQRSHEIAVRMALGAPRSHIVILVVKEGVTLAGIGLGAGLIGAYFVGRAMQSILFGTASLDSLTFDSVALLLFLVALLACYVPARRATQIDPMVALRHE